MRVPKRHVPRLTSKKLEALAHLYRKARKTLALARSLGNSVFQKMVKIWGLGLGFCGVVGFLGGWGGELRNKGQRIFFSGAGLLGWGWFLGIFIFLDSNRRVTSS